MLRRRDRNAGLAFLFNSCSALCTVVMLSFLKLGRMAASGGHRPLTLVTLLKLIMSTLRGTCRSRLRSECIMLMVRPLPVVIIVAGSGILA